MLELHLYDRVAAIPKQEWDALVGPEDSPFVEWTWLDCLEQAGCVGGESGWHPCHVGLYDSAVDSDGSDGAAVAGAPPPKRLIAVAPMYIKTNSEGEFVFDWSWADFAHRAGIPYYPKLVCAVPFTPVTGPRLLLARDLTADARTSVLRTLAHALLESAPKLGVHGVHILFPREKECALFDEVGYLSRYGIQYHWHNRGYTCFEDFLKDLPSKRRTQIRREVRQPELDGIAIETLTDNALTAELAETMYKLYLTTVDKFRWGRRYLNRRFFELVLERFRHRLAWVVARRDKDILAGAFNIRKGLGLYGRYWGTFVELPFLHYNVCYYHSIRECIANGIQVFEPGAGGEHKRARGFMPTLTHSSHYLRDRRLYEVLQDFLERERAAIRAELDGEKD